MQQVQISKFVGAYGAAALAGMRLAESAAAAARRESALRWQSGALALPSWCARNVIAQARKGSGTVRASVVVRSPKVVAAVVPASVGSVLPKPGSRARIMYDLLVDGSGGYTNRQLCESAGYDPKKVSVGCDAASFARRYGLDLVKVRGADGLVRMALVAPSGGAAAVESAPAAAVESVQAAAAA